MACLYANENFPFPVVEELRKLGRDVLTIQEPGKADRAQSDEEVLVFAQLDLLDTWSDSINLSGLLFHKDISSN